MKPRRLNLLLSLLIAAVAIFGASCGSDATVSAPVPAVDSQPQAPVLAEETPPPSTPAAVENPISYGPESEQFGRLQLPDSAAPDDGFPVVVLVHGGFWRQQFELSLMNGLADDLAERGFASWNIEYRRVGGAGGWPATGDDVAAAIDHLAEIANTQPLDLDRVVSVGHSAGGHLGLWALGEQERVELRGSIGLGAVVDLAYFPQAQGLLGGTIEQVPDVYADAAPVLDPTRVLLIQGSSDGIVPLQSLQVAEDAAVPILVVDGDDHFDLIDPGSASWAATVAAITEFTS